jgi:glycosyltransferase involved in cell wall biosynthesis
MGTCIMNSEVAEANTEVRPRVSIGVPVFNGERYLEQALDSIFAQTYQNFELIISDNGSSDGTEAICRRYAAADSRIRYYRHDKTRGVTWNFRQVVLRSTGEYFMWVAADDRLAPDYVERCVEVLDRESQVVLCYCRSVDMDEDGTVLRREEPELNTGASQPHERFRELIRMDHNCAALFGLIRAGILKLTPIHGDFADSDRSVLAELALYGKYYQIPQDLFFHHDHAERVTRQFPSRQQRMFKLHAERPPRFVLPHFRQFWEYLASIQRAPLPWGERLRCYLHMLGWIRDNSPRLWSDLRFVAWQILQPLRQSSSSE